MNDTHEHELRALLLACIVTVWIVAGSVGFAGGVAANEQYDLEATDGAGGNASFLFANLDNQLPEGEESGNDTLQVEAADPPLPNYFVAELTIDNTSDVTFSDQNESNVEAVVYGESVEDSENVEVRIVDERTLEVEADYDGADDDPLTLIGDDGEEDQAIGLRVNDLEFDAGEEEHVTVTWTIRNDETEYMLTVEGFDGDVDAIDENKGQLAHVTAGAANQTMAGVSDGGTFGIGAEHASNLVLRGDEGDFPERFTATVNLEEEGITFHDRDPERIVATSSAEGANAEVAALNETTIEVSVSNFDGESSDSTIVELDGVAYDVAADAGTENVTWQVFDESTNYTLVPEHLNATFADERYEFPRGLDGQPDEQDVTLVIDAEGKYTDGFHEHGNSNTMTVSIPDAVDEELSFDTDTAPTVTLNGKETSNVRVYQNETVFSFEDHDVDSGDVVRVEGIRFDTTGFDERTHGGNATIESGLDVQYRPVNDLENVTVASETDAVAAEVPSVDVEGNAPSILETDADGRSGTAALAINITDTVGGQLGQGQDIVVELAGDGVTFDESQDLRVVDQGADQDFFVRSDNINVSADEIVLSPDEGHGSSQEGDIVLLEATDGEGIKFDTTDAEDGDEVALAVTTNAGDAAVTQLTETAVEVREPGLEADRRTLALESGREVTVTVTDRYDEPVDGVTVTAESAGLGITEEATTDGDGVATFVFDLSGAESPDEITFDATVDGIDVGATVHTATLDANVTRIPADGTGATPIEITVNASDASARENVTVVGESPELGIEKDGTTGDEGSLIFELDADDDGVIDLHAAIDEAQLGTSVESIAPTIEHDPDQITAGENATVEVTITGLEEPDGDLVGKSNESVHASGDPYDIDETNETADGGVTTFEFDLSEETDGGEIRLDSTVDGIDLSSVVNVEASDDGDGETTPTPTPTPDGSDGDGDTTPTPTATETESGGTGGGSGSGGGSAGGGGGGSGGGGGGAAPPDPAPDVEITSTSINETEIAPNDAVAVTVTVENVGDGDGEYTVRLTSGGFTLASETVEVPAGETREVTLVNAFGEEGSYDLMVNDEAEVGTLYVGVEPAEVTASETIELVDEAPGEPGVYVTCENVAVQSITFHDESASGAVTVEELSRVPLDAAQPEGTVLQVVRIDVPDALENDSATIEIAVDADRLDGVDASADDLTVVHYDESADAWETLDTEVVGSDGEQVVVAGETASFSMFAVTAQDDEQPSTPTETPTETPTPTATDSSPDSSTPTETTGATHHPEEQSGVPNPFVLGGLVFAMIILTLLAVGGKRLYDTGGL